MKCGCPGEEKKVHVPTTENIDLKTATLFWTVGCHMILKRSVYTWFTTPEPTFCHFLTVFTVFCKLNWRINFHLWRKPISCSWKLDCALTVFIVRSSPKSFQQQIFQVWSICFFFNWREDKPESIETLQILIPGSSYYVKMNSWLPFSCRVF